MQCTISHKSEDLITPQQKPEITHNGIPNEPINDRHPFLFVTEGWCCTAAQLFSYQQTDCQLHLRETVNTKSTIKIIHYYLQQPAQCSQYEYRLPLLATVQFWYSYNSEKRTVHTASLFSRSSVIKICNSLTWDDIQLWDAVLSSEAIRHLAFIGTGIRQIRVYNNKQLIISSEEVSFCDNEVFAIFLPHQLRFWRSRGHTFQHNWFPSNDLFVFHWLHKWWWFWK